MMLYLEEFMDSLMVLVCVNSFHLKKQIFSTISEINDF